MKTLRYLFILALVPVLVSCEKFLEYPPQGAILAEDALKTPEDAQRLLNSCYDVLANLFDGSYQNLAELLSDNLAEPTGNDFQSVYNRSTNFFTPTTNGVYSDFYYTIYRCNSLLENFDLIDGLTEDDRARMEAEARFIRGICHWHVAKLYAQPFGATPGNSHPGIVLRDKAGNEPLARSTVGETYDFIIEDLTFAYNNLPETNDVYATKNAAAGMLAMVYFVMNDFPRTVQFSDVVIESGMYALNDTIDRFPNLENIALPNPETVFGIVSFSNDVRTEDLTGNYNASGVLPPNLTLSVDLNQLFAQNPADQRNNWISADGTKYVLGRFQGKVVFNIPIVYLTELMLIRAEAIAEAGQDLTPAINDINAIRARAFGGTINDLPSNATADQVIEAARIEYRKETVAEGKWMEQLKRRGAKGENIIIRGAPWNCPGMALQFPNGEFTSALFTGNPEGGCN
ncbi:MAG: RagB/SusD family nutrient uptake outer membrane protein [Flavobacteriales bacterium]